tara:strand:- start:269 stop:529 length:261 start_codon:yes stop_codon:yes gene_type:complete
VTLLASTTKQVTKENDMTIKSLRPNITLKAEFEIDGKSLKKFCEEHSLSNHSSDALFDFKRVLQWVLYDDPNGPKLGGNFSIGYKE